MTDTQSLQAARGAYIARINRVVDHISANLAGTLDLQALAAQAGMPDAFDRMVALVLLVPDALARVEALLPAGFPRHVFTSIRRGMTAQAERFVAQL